MILLALVILWGINNTISTNKLANKQGAIFTPDNAKIVALGEDIYDKNCASCHGAKLEGEADWRNPKEGGFLPAPPHDKSGHTWHHTDTLLFNITKYGFAKISNNENFKTNMPVFENVLSDDDIIAVLSYIKSTWPNEIKQRHDELNASGAQAQ